jgi:hypothetical protein
VRMRSLGAALVMLALSANDAAVHAQSTKPSDATTARSTPVALANPGFESREPGRQGAPLGWWKLQHAGPESYVFELDTTDPRSGERSLRVINTGPEPFGTILQKVSALPHRGQTLRFAAWIRTENAKGNRYGAGAGLKLHAVRGGYPAAHVSMRKDAVSGTTGWKRYELMLKVPKDADDIEVGLTLFGAGTAWIDDAELVVVEPGS